VPDLRLRVLRRFRLKQQKETTSIYQKACLEKNTLLFQSAETTKRNYKDLLGFENIEESEQEYIRNNKKKLQVHICSHSILRSISKQQKETTR